MDFDSLVADEIKVRFYGDTAIVTYRSAAKGKDQYGVIDEQRRWTRVVRSAGGALAAGPLPGDNNPEALNGRGRTGSTPKSSMPSQDPRCSMRLARMQPNNPKHAKIISRSRGH